MYILTFTEEQMHLINMAIGEIPHKLAVPLIQSINEQIVKAQAGAAAKADEAEKRISWTESSEKTVP